MTANRWSRRRCLVAAVAAVGLLPAAATAAAPAHRASAPASTSSARTAGPATPGLPGWPGWLDPARSPGYHVLNGVAEQSPGDVLTAGVGGPGGGQGRVWAWDGASWSSTHAPCPDACGLTAITRIGPDDAWAVGADHNGALPVALHYDGTQWTRAKLPTPDPDSADRLMAVSASGADDVWAAGYTVTGEELVVSPLIEHYDGHTWTKVDSVMPAQQAILYDVLAISPDDAWAVGGGPGVVIMEHWDGDRWREVRKGLGPAGGSLDLRSLTAVGSDDVWAAGERFVSDAPGLKGAARWAEVRLLTAVFHWDGTRWRRLDSRDTGRPRHWLFGIAARSDHDVWVVGGSGGHDVYIARHTLTEHYDGHTWRIVRSPDTGRATNVLNGVTIGPGGDAWAVGQASSDHNVHYRDLALHWDGHHWINQPVRPHHGHPAP